MNATKIVSILISFIIYLFPIPAVHITQTWGEKLWTSLLSHLTSPVEKVSILIFAILFQCFAAYCIYHMFMMDRSKRVLVSLFLLIFLYVALVIGQYVFVFLLFSVEKSLGILPM